MTDRVCHDEKAGDEIDANDQGSDERDPNGLSGKNKSDRTHSCTRTYPVTSSASTSRFFIHGMLRETSLNRDAFSKITRLINVGAPRDGHVIRQ